MANSETSKLLREYKDRVHVRYVPLNRGGYTSRGVYFGTGSRLYNIWDDDGMRDYYIRAQDRAEAVERARCCYPNAKIQP
jgi:hypothetical protein